ncbi:expressed unknown protein [Seminavis robusta]|uniref:Uncharacterized protein n=1 Tax=Seminavis robusta TaxID=568900 RepID=A0A9N8E004_9STRA|nr:expressed unknown protein [Seminavis robusta]|eukprot:Sro428_g140820.1 n/a (345) ;mRNA; f:19609-20722
MCPPSSSLPEDDNVDPEKAETDKNVVPQARPSSVRRSLRMSLSLVELDPELEEAQKLSFSEKPWPLSMFSGFSTERATMVTGLGCLSSSIVLAVRLYLDHSPRAYLIHSIIVFFDCILIHMFTHSLWLSITGEIITYVFFISFHFTKETVWELLETTLLAVISSFYLIGSRKQVMQERNELEDDIHSLRHRGALLLRNISQVHAAIREKEKDPHASVLLQVQGEQHQLLNQEDGNSDTDDETIADNNNTNNNANGHHIEAALDTELSRELLKQGECSCRIKTFKGRLNQWLTPFTPDPEACPNKLKCYKELFFEYFLDGAAGVMYTSFLGLIIDAFLNYGSSSY